MTNRRRREPASQPTRHWKSFQLCRAYGESRGVAIPETPASTLRELLCASAKLNLNVSLPFHLIQAIDAGINRLFPPALRSSRTGSMGRIDRSDGDSFFRDRAPRGSVSTRRLPSRYRWPPRGARIPECLHPG